MYKRYYDGYEAVSNALSIENNSNTTNTAQKGQIISSDNACDIDHDICNKDDVLVSGFANNNLFGMQTDDLILAGLLILLLFDSDNTDITLLIIIGVIFLAGLNI